MCRSVIAVYLVPGGERVTHWWLRHLITYSLYPVAYAALIQVSQVLVFGFQSGSSIFASPVLKALLFVVAVGVLREVPKLLKGITGAGGISIKVWK